ncbi:unnamed protein product [Owenia fusiformis]|uniref:phosphorylase kinase n=1 Tax=Owenia fusiformis TaxID=6347 RepID=A0A8J1TJN6_OWEFU|nr:unnamed protein product [Owenia fusiformis]
MAITDMEEDYDLPDASLAKEFYAKYEPKEVLGKGISSVVRRCIEKQTGQEYAVKIMDVTEETTSDVQADEVTYAVKKEINILKMCAGHHHIIALHDTFESSTFIFLVFELCRKGELFDYLTQVVTLSEKRTRTIMRQLIEAVAFIHDKGIIHRDLKPENILLDDNLNIMLSDFGFAHVMAQGETLTDLCGTPGYLAPEVLAVSMYEQVDGYGCEVDMWAVGVIMYTLLSGHPPFWHRKQMYMLRAIMEGKYKFGSPEWDDISDPPKDLISKLLVVNPKKRLTAKQALEHPFFKRETVPVKEFNAKRTFKVAIIAVLTTFRIRNLHFNPPPISIDTIKHDPYSVKNFRKIIDGCAFKVYAHWVKKGEEQNRAALFEITPKMDLKVAQNSHR